MAQETTDQVLDPASPLLGATLRNTYTIIEVLDQGGMGMVFVAEHVRLRRRVAVKILARHLAGDAHALARFQREAEIISQLAHPNVVQVMDFDTTVNGEPYLVMELLEGESLETRLNRERKLSVTESVRIVNQVASGLTAAHRVDIVHRDLKPANVFLVDLASETTFVKLLDFGISKRAGVSRGLTGEFDILGTPDYMAPEQASGKTAHIDHRGDQFSLAVIAYEMITGALPFAGNNVTEVLQRVLNDTPVQASALNPRLPATADRVLLRALSKDPDQRYGSIGAFAQALAVASGCSVPPSYSKPPPIERVEFDEPQQATGVRLSESATLERRSSSAPSVGRESQPDTGRRSRRAAHSTAVTEAIAEFMEGARTAFGKGEVDGAVGEIELALDLADQSDDKLAGRAIEGAETLITKVLEARLGKLTRKVLVKPGGVTTGLSPGQAFVLSRLEGGGVTLEEALDLSPMPRQKTLRALVRLVRAGLIEVA